MKQATVKFIWNIAQVKVWHPSFMPSMIWLHDLISENVSINKAVIFIVFFVSSYSFARRNNTLPT